MTAPAPPPAPALRIALVGPVAQAIPPARSGSIETVTAMLADGLVARGQDVTLFAAASSTTAARLHAVFADGYNHDTDLWPWELCELLNLAAAVERAAAFDLIHYQAEYAPLSLAWTRVSPVPVVQTLHHAPSPTEVALWSRYPEAPFVAVSRAQADLLTGLNVAGTIHHAVDPRVFGYRAAPDDYLLFLGRFTAGKGCWKPWRWPGAPATASSWPRPATSTTAPRWHRWWTATAWCTPARPTSRPRSPCCRGRALCSIRCRRRSRSVWC